MEIRPRDIYKPRRKFRTLLTIVFFVAAFVLIGAVVIFYAFQKYIVYDPDGLHLEVPFLTEPSPADSIQSSAAPSDVQAEIVIVTPDYSEVENGAGEGLGELHALFIAAENITAETLSSYAASLENLGANALLL